MPEEPVAAASVVSPCYWAGNGRLTFFSVPLRLKRWSAIRILAIVHAETAA
jgi:hypothetical protein